jgi:hypothetical protein
LAVKVGKKLLRDNTRHVGSLNTDNFMRAMLQYRNTPMQDCRRAFAVNPDPIIICYISNSLKGLHTNIWKAPMFLAEQENPGKTAEEIREGEKGCHLTCT